MHRKEKIPLKKVFSVLLFIVFVIGLFAYYVSHHKSKIKTLYFFILGMEHNKIKSEEKNRPMRLKDSLKSIEKTYETELDHVVRNAKDFKEAK